MQCGTRFVIVVLAVLVVSVVPEERLPVYTDQFVVQVNGGPEVAKELARKHGFTYHAKILDDYYVLRHQRLAKRSLDRSEEHHIALSNEPQVRWFSQQLLKRRIKRDYREETSRGTRTKLNDPRWPQMWYLNRGAGLDMNVQEAWAQGVTGKGIVVTILDDGLEKDHPDIMHNYDKDASYDVNNHDGDPQPRYDMHDSNSHGTRCAGEVAASANNSICAVGVAYEALVGGVRMLDGDVTDVVEAQSLSLNPEHIDIYSASWGPDDDGKTVDGPGPLASTAFKEGILKGRSGKGSIFVWASGNGGREYDNCNCDGYTNSMWTLSISSATENGQVPWYSEACSSTLATAYSSGANGERQIVTTDLHHGCTSTHIGTSASSPLAAGICALALEANKNLTWRDMQHIVVRTARRANLHAKDWKINGVGRSVSHSFGYGLMDAGAMVRLAKRWSPAPVQKLCEIRSDHADKLIPAKSYVELSLMVRCEHVRFLEHVQAKITLSASRRGDIHIYLTSPHGTRSTLLAQRPIDGSRAGFNSWPFMTVHNWGEDPDGIWKLEVHNDRTFLGRASLKEWYLHLYGTTENPDRPLIVTAPPTTTTVQTTIVSTPTTITTVAMEIKESDIFCESPAPPANGFISELLETNTSTFPYNFRINYDCNEGYRLVGSDRGRLCGKNGWTGITPYCLGQYNFDNGAPVTDILNSTAAEQNEEQNAKLPKSSPNSSASVGGIFDINLPGRLIIYFVFDASRSVGKDNFDKSIEFAKAVVRKVRISENGTRAGVLKFGSPTTEKVFLPFDFESTDDVLDALDKTEYKDGRFPVSTSVLSVIREEFIPLTHAFFGSNVRNVIFVLTDGRTTMGGRSRAIMEANLLKRAGVEIYCIGISDRVREELLHSITSKSEENNPKVFILKNYSSTQSLLQDITKGDVDYSQCGLRMESQVREVNRGRIVGGNKSEQPWPWMAALFMPYKKSNRLYTVLKCGGSIITEKFILTAAHCMYYRKFDNLDKEEITVKLGLTDLKNETYFQKYKVEEILIHPKYRPGTTFDYDIALLQLDRKIIFNAFVRPICLPPSELPLNSTLYSSDEFGWAIGWGNKRILSAISRHHPRAGQYLKEIVLPLQPRHRCIQSLVEYASYFTNRMFCAGDGRGGNDTCQRDSGGPMMQLQMHSEGYFYWTQVGIVSWGLGCGLVNTYGFYTHVQSLRQWIDSTILEALAAAVRE